MKAITCIILLASFVIIYFILCKIFTTLFQLTGLSRSKSRFQAYSLFIGCGFTTSESELIMYDPTRRKLALICSITGFIFSTIIIGLVIGVVAALDFHSDNGPTYVFDVIITFITSLIVFILVLVFSKVKPIANFFTKLLRKMYYKRHKSNGENVIIYTDMIYDKFIAAIELNKVPEQLKGKTFKEIGFGTKYDVKILVCGKKDVGMTSIIKDDYYFNDGIYLEVFGSVKDINELFTVKK